MFNKIKNGFTLAEVLITLVIIGVVAALTIPTAIAKYQKTQTVTKLKKCYSTLAQTTRRAVIDHGNVENWELGAANTANSALTFFNTYLAPYLSLSAEAKKTGWDRNYFYLNGIQEEYEVGYIRAYLADGSSITMFVDSSTDTDKKVRVNIDINGDKKPNKCGKDIFVFYYYIRYTDYSGQFQPMGFMRNKEHILRPDVEGNCNKSQSGSRCAAVIMKDGWQIKDDYPW